MIAFVVDLERANARVCARGHHYSTENAPSWLGSRCPRCRAVTKAAWESRFYRICGSDGQTIARFPMTPDGATNFAFFRGLIAERRAQVAEKRRAWRETLDERVAEVLAATAKESG